MGNDGAMAAPASHLSFVWDYDLEETQFRALLAGETTIGRLDRDWAVVRLLDHGAYGDILRLLGFPALAAGWPRWRDRVRSESRRRGLDFVVWWLSACRRRACAVLASRRRTGT